ncbi:MAG TPA: hypothetical protein VGS99_04415 [Gammaproteobacteria bacterium]|nr:hypothetical protein [Gammaproteobacteria bacterium]
MKKLFIAVAALAVVLAGCGSMGGGASASGMSVLQSGSHSAQKDEALKDFHNQADLDAFMATAFDKGGAPSVKVDWNTQMVVAFFVGAKQNTGIRAAITKVDDSGAQVQVSSKVVIPCEKQSRPEPSSPYIIVAAPASTKTVNFSDPDVEYQKC